MRSITQYLSDILAADRLKEQAKHTNQESWYPSSLGGCERAAVLSRAGFERNPIDPITLRKFWIGSELHASLQSALERAMVGEKGVKFLGHELEVKDSQYNVSGKVDTLVEVDGDIEVWEYKTAASRSFSYSDFPKKEHILQVGVYLTFGATPAPKKGIHKEQEVLLKYPLPKRARLIYLSKDDARVEEYVITPDYEVDGMLLSEKVKETLTSLESGFQAFKKDGTLPLPMALVEKVTKGKAEMVQPWQVRYCDFRGTGKCCGDIGD